MARPAKKSAASVVAPSAVIDPKALKILQKSYWSSSGWRDPPVTSPADFAYARAAGLMFDPVTYDHNGAVRWLVQTCRQVQATDVARAFLASLSTRRLDLRSALGSYAVFRHLPVHAYAPHNPANAGGRWCRRCGLDGKRETHDLNVLNFERFKWGGVRHQDVIYAALDLERFLATERPAPTDADVATLRGILDAARSLGPKARASNLEPALASLVKSNKAERAQLLTILAYAGILQSPHCPGFLTAYVDISDREAPDGHDSEWEYPINWWRGSDGVHDGALHYWFPELA